MIPAAFLDHTIARFPRFNREKIVAEAIEKGGSGRSYYRISDESAASLILVKYTNQREENRHFCDIADFLYKLGVSVPQIYHHDTDEGLIWVEDLGAIDLWHYRDGDWSDRRALYRSTLAQILHLHLHGHVALEQPVGPDEIRPTFQQSFDADLYHWEQNYFFENCVGRHFGISADEIAQCFAGAARKKLDSITHKLAALPRVLVHRDFQSQNVMIRDGRASLIDFQGMRPGLGQYDLASLLYDPYVQLSADERQALVDDYITLAAEAGHPVTSDFHEIYDLCALQRLMQALGAYGFLGHEKGLTSFLAHIPIALPSLHEVASRIAGLEDFVALIEECLNRLKA